MIFLEILTSVKCTANETYYTCNKICKAKCVNGTIIPPQPICSDICLIGCDCLQGYVRNSSNVCVHQCDCN